MKKNTENKEMTFDKENMNAIEASAVSSDLSDLENLVHTGNDELNVLTMNLMVCDGLDERIKAYKSVTLAYIKNNFARIGGKTGCKDVVEYGKKFLNYEKAQVNFLIQIAEKYISLNEKEYGETLPALTDFKYNIIKDIDGYTMKIGQLQEIISVDREKVLEAIASGTIDATSTQKELREWKKAVKNTIDTTATDDTTDDATDDTTDDTTESPMTDRERLSAILNIISGIQNDEIQTALTKAVEKAEKVLAKS